MPVQGQEATNNNTTQNANAGTHAQQNAYQGGTNSTYTEQQGSGMNNQNSFRNWGGGGLISRSTSTEAVTAFLEIGNKIIAQNGATSQLKLIAIPQEVARIEIPVIVMYRTMQTQGRALTIVRPIIYGTEQLQSRKLSFAGYGNFPSEIEIESAPGDAYTDNLWNAIADYLRTTVGITGEIKDAAAMSVPQHFVPTESTMPAVIWSTATMIESFAALVADPNAVPELNPEMFRNGKTEARLDFNPKPITDAVGNPIRADWAVSLAYTEHNQNNTDPFAQNRQPIINAYGYVDLVATNLTGQQQGQFGGYGVNPLQQQPYVAMIIITHVETHMKHLTVGMLQLALHATTAIIDGATFTRVFRAKANAKMKRNIGALGIEVPALCKGQVPGVIDVQSDDSVFFTLIQMAINRNPLVAIDIEETGDNSTITQVIRMVADNDQQALKMWQRAADTLTAGGFSQIANQRNLAQAAIAESDDNRIALGHYAADGQIYDRREVDRLALLTALGPTDIAVVQQYDDSLNNKTIPPEVRLRMNMDIVNGSILAGSSPVTGYARRIVVGGAYLAVINDAIRGAGINITASGVNYDGQTQRGRDYSSISSMQYQATTGYFTTQSQYNNTGFSMGARFGGGNTGSQW